MNLRGVVSVPVLESAHWVIVWCPQTFFEIRRSKIVKFSETRAPLIFRVVARKQVSLQMN